MKRRAAFILSTMIVVAILVAAVLSVASAAPLPETKIFEFVKLTGNATVEPGQSFTVTLEVYPISLTDNITFTVADPNEYPAWMEVVTDSLTGGAVYDEQLQTVFWNGSISPTSLRQSVTFQMRVKDSAVINQSTLLTNTAFVGIDPAYAGSLPPGSLPGTLPPTGSLPAGFHGAAWDTFTVNPSSQPPCTPITSADFTFTPPLPVMGQEVFFTGNYEPVSATLSAATWDFGGMLPGSGMTATRVFEGAGVFTATWTVVDTCGTSKSVSYPVTVRPGVAEEIGPGGGTLVFTDTNGSVSIEVPAGALTETITLVYVVGTPPTTSPSGMTFAGRAFSLEVWQNAVLVPNYGFDSPLVFTIYYTDVFNMLNANLATVNETSLKLFYWDNNWYDVVNMCTPSSSYQRNFTDNYFTIGVCRTNDQFALFGVSEYKLYLPLLFKNA